MTERTWNTLRWLGLIVAMAMTIVCLFVYATTNSVTTFLIFFVLALIGAIVSAVANIGFARARRVRWDNELAGSQQQTAQLFATARDQALPKHLGPAGRTLAAAEGETVAVEEAEHERAEHGNWE